MSNAEAIERVTTSVVGVDLHPLAVTFARITYLLAIGRERIRGTRGGFRIPVYLGDSIQWGQEQNLLNAGSLTLPTGSGDQLFANELSFPDSLIADAERFDRLVVELTEKANNRPRNSPVPALNQTFRRFPMSDQERAAVTATFSVMCQLHDEDRDHIWGYYLRNQARPMWLTNEANRVDVLIGNPPWLTFNAIAAELKPSFRQACELRNLWGGGRATRNYDLCTLFVVRTIELYLRPGGSFGFVMPFATLSRRQFAGFRAGDYPSAAQPVSVAFAPPWDMSAVRPHPFPVPCCVVFGSRSEEFNPVPLPPETTKWSGTLPARNVEWEVAEGYLSTSSDQIAATPEDYASVYSGRFESGAKLSPQVLVIVEPAPEGPLGVPSGLRSVRSISSTRDPWRGVAPLQGNVEAEFVRPLHQGSTIVPFRALEPMLAIVPWDRSVSRLLSSSDDALDRYPRLADWWRRASALWDEHGTPENYDLTGRIDFQSKLSRQLPTGAQRVAYSKSGSRLTAARLPDASLASETLYWGTAGSLEEARYLTAVLNSQTVTALVAPYQSQGQFGTRHFDLYVWYVNIPEFSSSLEEHLQLAELAAEAEAIAERVELPTGIGPAGARRRVRDALASSGVADRIEQRVRELLGVGDG